MADDRDDASKTEEPTSKRLDEARKRGQVAMSREVNNWFVLLAATLALAFLAPGIGHDLKRLMVRFLGGAHELPADGAGLRDELLGVSLATGLAIGPVMLAILVAGIASGVVQVGWLMAPEAMKPDLGKISPLKGFSRLFSTASVVEFVKGIVKMAAVGAAAWFVLAPELDVISLYVARAPEASLAALGALVLKLLIAVVAVMTLIAAFDLVYQRIRLRRELMMTRTEVRDEYKEQEGDPAVKAKLRQIRAERSRRRMMQAVPKADVVITNPTHYAVALKYDRETMEAPILVAKGFDRIALKIREIAQENDVPVVENPPLARALHAAVELDQPIPPEHYRVVAEIISYVWKLRSRGAGRGANS
jgi:flagellar biosynthetic protein FlhB